MWGIVTILGVIAGLLVPALDTGTWVFVLVLLSAACVGILQQTLP